jgi:hypothetical protein
MQHLFLVCEDCHISLTQQDSCCDVKRLVPLWVGYICEQCGQRWQLHVRHLAVTLMRRRGR